MLDWKEILIRLSLAALLGALIGLERERKNWTAGMRTHMMVCVGSALIMMVSSFGFSDVLGTPHIVLDPARIAAQVISGIGFIGAGTILFGKQGTIRGLTTASGLWTVAAIGLASGGGMYFAAAAATVLALIILWGLQPFEKKFSRRFKQKTLIIEATQYTKATEILQRITEINAVSFTALSIDKTATGSVIQLTFDEIDTKGVLSVLKSFENDPTVKEIIWN